MTKAELLDSLAKLKDQCRVVDEKLLVCSGSLDRAMEHLEVMRGVQERHYEEVMARLRKGVSDDGRA